MSPEERAQIIAQHPECIGVLMARRGYQDQDLAWRLKISRQAVGTWRRGEKTPRGRRIYALADEFGALVDELAEERGWAAPAVPSAGPRQLYRRPAMPVDERIDARYIQHVPVLGTAPGGPGVESYELHDAELDLPRLGPKIKPDFALRIRGDSMIMAGIPDGSYVYVHSTHEARPGAIVVARVGTETTVKRLDYIGDGSMVALLPEHPQLKPTFLPKEHVTIIGVVVAAFAIIS